MKKTGKRWLAALLAVIMTVGVLPMSALAEGAESDPVVKSGYYNDSGVWTEGTLKQTLPTGVLEASKTAKPVESKDNQYTVTLTVKTKTTTTSEAPSAAATVLVMDTSGSMDYCAECGSKREGHTPHSASYTETYDVYGLRSGWSSYYYKDGDEYKPVYYCGKSTHGKEHDRQSCPGYWFTTDKGSEHTAQNMLTPKTSADDTDSSHVQFYTKVPAEFVSRLDSAKNAAETFLKTYSGRYDENGTKTTTQELNLGRYVSLVEFNTLACVKAEWVDVSNASGYETVLNAIKGLNANGGTNLEQGLVKASDQLKKETVTSISEKNVIALTDGVPTFYGEYKELGRKNAYGHGNNGCPDTNAATVTAATALKASAKLYTVCFGATDTLCWEKGSVHKEHVLKDNELHKNDGPTVGTFLSESIATGTAYAYNAGNTAELMNAFAAITKSIVSGISSGTVTDSLPTGITLADKTAAFDGTWTLTAENVTSKETVNGTTTYTWTKSYVVEIDPTKAISVGGYAALNGATTLTTNNGEVSFPIPAGKITYPTYTVTYEYDSNAPAGVTAPTDSTGYTVGQTVTVKNPDRSTVEKDGYTYTFNGWKNGEKTVATSFTMPAKDVTLTGGWTKTANAANYKVEHYQEGLDGKYTLKDTDTINSTTDAKVTAEAKTYEGFTVDMTVKGTVASGTVTANAEHPLTLKLYYTRNKYTVTYDANGGTNAPDAQTKTYNVDLTLSSTEPTRTGYTFNGWNTAADGTGPSYAKGATYSGNANLTLYAQWTDNTEPEPDIVEVNLGDYVKKTYKSTYGWSNTATFNFTAEITGQVAKGAAATESTKYNGSVTITTGETKAVNFRTISLEEGSYYVKVSETKGNAADVTYDKALYTFILIVYSDGEKDFVEITSQTKFSDGDINGAAEVLPEDSVAVFTNTYDYYYWNPTPVTPDLNTEDHVAYIIGFTDGTIRPEANITRGEVATIFFRLLTDEARTQYWSQTNSYSDVPADMWCNNAISTLSNMGIINGYLDGTFRPNAPITRSELTKIAVSFFKYADMNKFAYDGRFPDVKGTEWYANYLAAAVEFGLIEGDGNGYFRPNDPITRAETCTIVNRTLGRKPDAAHLLADTVMITWPDNSNVNAWYYAAMQEATNSHDYTWTTVNQEKVENWTAKLTERDWAALERMWSNANSAPGGEVMD